MLAVRRSLCDVDVLSYTGNAGFPGCWERKRRPDIRGRRSKRRVSSDTARHSKKIANLAKLSWVGGLIGVCELRSSQPAWGHGKRGLTQQACGSRHLSGFFNWCGITIYA